MLAILQIIDIKDIAPLGLGWRDMTGHRKGSVFYQVARGVRLP